MIGPKDENILEVALIESEQDIQCEAPVFLLRELNEESLENHKGYYSVYGFYVSDIINFVLPEFIPKTYF